jgi:hypothetical protein
MMNTAMLSEQRAAKEQGNQGKKQPWHGTRFENTSSANLFRFSQYNEFKISRLNQHTFYINQRKGPSPQCRWRARRSKHE